MFDLHRLAVLGRVHEHFLSVRRRLTLERALELAHLAGFAVHEDNVRGRQRVEELLRLGVIGMRREGDGVH